MILVGMRFPFPHCPNHRGIPMKNYRVHNFLRNEEGELGLRLKKQIREDGLDKEMGTFSSEIKLEK